MKLPRIGSPPVCRRAWAKHLKAEGATVEEIADALRLPPRFVRAMLRPSSRITRRLGP